MDEDYTRLRDFAQKHLDDSCNNNGHDIRFWIGYLEGLNALYKACRQEVDCPEVEE